MAIKIVLPGDESAIEKHARWVAAQEFKRVLDVGGAAKPLRTATHVLDIIDYPRRRIDQGRGGLPERFDIETWETWDVNETPWPFRKNLFQYVWCCQVVEDIRDPIAVCREMMRVGRAGFISTVHRDYESSVVQYDGVVGYHHHRWLVETSVLDGITFTFKSPMLHVTPSLRPPRSDQWLLHWAWRDEFEVEEKFTGGDQEQRQELLDYLTRRQ